MVLDELYFEGELAATGNTLMAALRWLRPEFGREGPLKLPQDALALKGFTKTSPPHSRLPIPMVVMTGMSMLMCHLGERAAALSCLLASHLYLRPLELRQMRWLLWPPPAKRGMGGVGSWCVTLHPEEEGVSSKTD